MKRLFRSSKPDVSPLPPPPPPPLSSAPPGPAPPPDQRANAVSPVPPQAQRQHHQHQLPHPHLHHHGQQQGSVTPFPLDSPAGAAPRPKGSKEQLGAMTMAANGVPSLAEMQAQYAQQQQPPPPPPPSAAAQQQQKVGRKLSLRAKPQAPPPAAAQVASHSPRGTGAQSPEGWTIVSPQSLQMPLPPTLNGDVPYTSAPGLPQPPFLQPSHHQGSSPTVTPGLYLPPGARPPSPQLRPATPTKYPFSSSPSQTSLNGPFALAMNEESRQRDRGYSSASSGGGRSDYESSVSHSQAHSHSHHTAAKLSRSPQAAGVTRSPLVKSYQQDSMLTNGAGTGIQAFPSPQPFGPPLTNVPNPYSPVSDDPHTNNLQTMEAFSAPQNPRRDLRPPPPDAATRPIEGREKEKEKEKKKFWGVAWERKEKTRERDRDRGMDTSRGTIEEDGRFSTDGADGSVLGHQAPSSTGHTVEETRGKLLGLDLGKFKESGQADSVTFAIQMLCTRPEPPLAAIYDVTERINHSHSPDSVAKEASRAIRKQFKHGNEAERRAAAKVWLILMRNISTKGFRAHASNKKFMASLEPILMAPPSNPLVSAHTHRMITDILADLVYQYGNEKGCEALGELWCKVKMPQEAEGGVPLPSDHHLYTPEAQFAARFPDTFTADLTPPGSVPSSRRGSSAQHTTARNTPAPAPLSRTRSPAYGQGGPQYEHLTNHEEDMRRLIDECTAAKESARVLAEALVYTRPEELEQKPIIREFYQKCFHAHESLTNQMDWAQAEAARSRERVDGNALMNGIPPEDGLGKGTTVEEKALGALFEAHGQLAESLKQHDDLSRMAMDERELREVRERSKKETRIDRNVIDPTGGLSIPDTQQASSSRSPSPGPYSRLPEHSPRRPDLPLPPSQGGTTPFDRSRTPSPDTHDRALPHPPKLPGTASPRAPSPLGLHRAQNSRPLPVPLKNGNTYSDASVNSHVLVNGQPMTRTHTSERKDTGSSGDADAEAEEEEVVRDKPSRKALGKRRAIPDEDNHFNPDDMFFPNGDANALKRQVSRESSEESLMADEVYLSKPVEYAYDAYQEKVDQLKAVAAASSGGSGSSEGEQARAQR